MNLVNLLKRCHEMWPTISGRHHNITLRDNPPEGSVELLVLTLMIDEPQCFYFSEQDLSKSIFELTAEMDDFLRQREGELAKKLNASVESRKEIVSNFNRAFGTSRGDRAGNSSKPTGPTGPMGIAESEEFSGRGVEQPGSSSGS